MKAGSFLLSVLAICLLAGALQAPAMAETYTSVFSGWVDNGKTVEANGCFVTFSVSNGSAVHVSVNSPDYPSAEANVPPGNAYYYYNVLRIYVSATNAQGQTLADISKCVSSSQSSGTKVWCDTPGQKALGGDLVTFPINIQNNNANDVTYDLSADGSGWDTSFLYNGKDIYQIYVPASQSRTVSLAVQTPYSAAIGEKTINAKVGDSSLDVRLYITSVNQTVEVSTKVDSLIASIGDKVYYDISLQNLQSKQNDYKLSVTGLPENWYYRYVDSRGSTSEMAEDIVPASTTKSLVLEIVPPYTVSEGDYNFTAVVTTPDNTTITRDLTLKLKSGTSMGVASDKLAYSAKPGQAFNINVYVTNNGRGSALTNVKPEITAPTGWVVSSSPETATSIKAGETQTFVVSVQPPGNIVASDYSVNIKVTSDQAQSDSDYRITITTDSYIPYLAGAIIVIVLAGLVLMYRKYGRR
jgi:uncharacterized membrane protein